jgi:PIN domain nuclease of toxin-antitoxin system
VASLIDTHAFLWWTQDDPKLSARARKAIAGSECYFSLASCWEAAIKVSLKRLQFDRPLADFFTEEPGTNGISLLEIGFRHVMREAGGPYDCTSTWLPPKSKRKRTSRRPARVMTWRRRVLSSV